MGLNCALDFLFLYTPRECVAHAMNDPDLEHTCQIGTSRPVASNLSFHHYSRLSVASLSLSLSLSHFKRRKKKKRRGKDASADFCYRQTREMDPKADKLVRRTTMVATVTAAYFLLTADYGPNPNALDPIKKAIQSAKLSVKGFFFNSEKEIQENRNGKAESSDAKEKS